MNRTTSLLAVALVVQIGLAFAITFAGKQPATESNDGPLVSLSTSALEQLRIVEKDATELTLVKEDGTWKVPQTYDFPAEKSKLEQLVNKLNSLQKGYPIATTKGAAKRFKVTDAEFEKKITWKSGSEESTLYIGSSPGFKKVHMRTTGDDNVYAVNFSAFEASTKAKDWLAKGYLTHKQDEIEKIEMPDYTLQRTEDGLALVDLAENEITDTNHANNLARQIAGISFESVLGTENKPEYQQDKPLLTVDVTLQSGESITYVFSPMKDSEDDIVLKASNSDYYFKAIKLNYDLINDATREKIATAKPEPEENTADVDTDAAADAEVETSSTSESESGETQTVMSN